MPRKPKQIDIDLMRRALGMALVSIRKRRGLQQQEVAAKVETTRGHLSAMETGKGDPKFSMFCRIAAVLGVSPLVLMVEIVRHYNDLKKQS